MKHTDGIKEELRSSVEPAQQRPEQQTPERQRVLRTAANGMQVWVPEDRLESWERAQEAQRSGTESAADRERRSSLSLKIMSRLSELNSRAPGK